MAPAPPFLYFALLVRRRLVFFWGAGTGRLALALAARCRSHDSVTPYKLDAEYKKQQHKTELVGWFVGCFSNHTLRNYATWFGQLTISHIKQQAPSLQLRTEC